MVVSSAFDTDIKVHKITRRHVTVNAGRQGHETITVNMDLI
jgi:hypothetical protein